MTQSETPYLSIGSVVDHQRMPIHSVNKKETNVFYNNKNIDRSI